jgi:hypothetical protein
MRVHPRQTRASRRRRHILFSSRSSEDWLTINWTTSRGSLPMGRGDWMCDGRNEGGGERLGA